MKNIFRKLGIISVICLFAFMAIASGSSAEDETPVNEDGAKSNTSSVASEDITIDEQVLLDRDGVKITAKEYVKDSIWGDGIKLLIENNSDRNLNVSCDALVVNDYMISDLFYCDVAAGKKSNETLYLSSSQLKNAGIDNVGKIEIDFYASDDDTYDRIFENEFVTIQTSAFDVMDSTSNVSGAELYNNNGIKIVATVVENNDLFGSAVVLYAENNSGKNVSISCDDMSVNGFMVSPLFSSLVYAGKKAVDEITIFESDLEENGIESIEEIELSFRIYDSDSYNTIDETEPILFSAK